MKIKKSKLKELLEQAFEGGETYGRTYANFYNSDSVSKSEYETTPAMYEVVADIMVELKNNEVKK